MNALTIALLRAFWMAHPDAEAALRAWNQHIRARAYGSFAEVRADFPGADWVAGFIVFDIRVNHYRLIVRPNFEGKRFYIQAVLTHKQYDAWTQEMRSK